MSFDDRLNDQKRKIQAEDKKRQDDDSFRQSLMLDGNNRLKVLWKNDDRYQKLAAFIETLKKHPELQDALRTIWKIWHPYIEKQGLFGVRKSPLPFEVKYFSWANEAVAKMTIQPRYYAVDFDGGFSSWKGYFEESLIQEKIRSRSYFTDAELQGQINWDSSLNWSDKGITDLPSWFRMPEYRNKLTCGLMTGWERNFLLIQLEPPTLPFDKVEVVYWSGHPYYSHQMNEATIAYLDINAILDFLAENLAK